MDDDEFMVFDPDGELEWEIGIDREIIFTPEGTGEIADFLARAQDELTRPLGDGQAKRAAGEKPPWWTDPSHEAAIFSHLCKWKRGEVVDVDSGAHPLVHAAVRCLMIAFSESGNTPEGDGVAGFSV